ncbi:LysE family transporter [Bacillus ginsengihumi]|uniref:LysE family transporter n=1 Tax=Heyndrickxia ginsengihumi TaxID=363870 RepID=A0A6M0P2X2_9BACI|nr:LysE family transporter [Heyndrickxia ginsengihumi]MBE6184053.1 amino acid transporter [Bacillus sp. (in: firmicutes)]NEY18783.1 LysE family transporter [Heyndrickxia ginsengihumi]
MGVLLSYFLLGISLAAPIGPINAAQLNSGIKNGFLSAWLVGVGAVVADGFYMMAVYLGIVEFINTPFVKTFLWLFGCFVLIYTGVESIINARKIHINDDRNSEPVYKSFFSGFFMSITNPLTILFWLGIYGSILAKTADSYVKADLVLCSCAIFLGLFLWDITMATISSSFRKILTSKLLASISILSGVSLIGFGIYFGVQAVNLLLGNI